MLGLSWSFMSGGCVGYKCDGEESPSLEYQKSAGVRQAELLQALLSPALAVGAVLKAIVSFP